MNYNNWLDVLSYVIVGWLGFLVGIWLGDRHNEHKSPVSELPKHPDLYCYVNSGMVFVVKGRDAAADKIVVSRRDLPVNHNDPACEKWEIKGSLPVDKYHPRCCGTCEYCLPDKDATEARNGNSCRRESHEMASR